MESKKLNKHKFRKDSGMTYVLMIANMEPFGDRRNGATLGSG